jgi:hypothetical protein
MPPHLYGYSEDRVRNRVYKGLLLFIILAGAPTMAIPTLRHRLFHRIHVLKTAWTMKEPPSVQGINADAFPFPKEFERPKGQTEDVAVLRAFARSVLPSKEMDSTNSPIKTIRILDSAKQKKRASSSDSVENGAEMENASQEDSVEAAPQYKQDKNEKEAYEIVLKSNKTLSEMVRGGNSSLHLKSWGAASRGEDVYWVRVVFLNQEKAEVEYIWEVKLASKEAAPLSYNARSISS